jgi:NAD-dependent dihydropyrimidine dehydrogenase PreA subunit
MGRFIEIEIDSSRLNHHVARAVVGACPVDAFSLDSEGRLTSVAENEDECILCGRCVELAPEAVVVRRRYGAGRAVTASGGSGEDG